MYYNSISAMPQYNMKSHEELRWEDYQVQPRTVPLSTYIISSCVHLCSMSFVLRKGVQSSISWLAGWVQGQHRRTGLRWSFWADLRRPLWAGTGQRALWAGQHPCLRRGLDSSIWRSTIALPVWGLLCPSPGRLWLRVIIPGLWRTVLARIRSGLHPCLWSGTGLPSCSALVPVQSCELRLLSVQHCSRQGDACSAPCRPQHPSEAVPLAEPLGSHLPPACLARPPRPACLGQPRPRRSAPPARPLAQEDPSSASSSPPQALGWAPAAPHPLHHSPSTLAEHLELQAHLPSLAQALPLGAPRLPLGRQAVACSGSRPPSQLSAGAFSGSRAHQALGLGSPSQPLEEAASLAKPAHRPWVQACLAGRPPSTSHLRATSNSQRTNKWYLHSLLVSASESVLQPGNTLSSVPSWTAYWICLSRDVHEEL